MNPLAMLFAQLTVFAVCNLVFGCWMIYRDTRRTRIFRTSTAGTFYTIHLPPSS